MAHMAPQQGMNWREYMGSIICLIGYKVIFIRRDYMEAISRGRLGKVKVVKAYIKAKFTLDYLGKEEPGCLGRLEEAAFSCREHSCQKRDQLR